MPPRSRVLSFAMLALLVAGCGTVTKPLAVDSATNTDAAPAVSEDQPTPETTPTPAAKDFTLRVKTLKKACFGSAGCNVTYTIRVAYSGPTLPEDQEYSVTYKVVGGEDPMINTFTMAGAKANVPGEEFVSTSSSSAVLKAKVTDVE